MGSRTLPPAGAWRNKSRNNLYAACIPCNREKSHRWSTRTVRAWNGRKRAPLSRAKRQEAKQQQALAGAVLCGIAGSVFGPLGAIIGAAVDEQSVTSRIPIIGDDLLSESVRLQFAILATESFHCCVNFLDLRNRAANRAAALMKLFHEHPADDKSNDHE